MSATLLILAAGLGSRFGGGVKQLTPVGQNGELLMDYCIDDAVEAGFDRVVFIIRKDIEDDFKEIIIKRTEKKVKCEYRIQSLDALPAGFSVPEERTKPWGTVAAVLAAKDILDEPYLIVNADDYYGKTTFRQAYDFLTDPNRGRNAHCMCGFILGNTLSDRTPVTRGVCTGNDNNELVSVCETYKIFRENGAVYGDVNGVRTKQDPDSIVSMNMWGFGSEINPLLERCFAEFLENAKNSGTLDASEYPLPFAVDTLIKKGEIGIKIIPTHEKWYGMTTKEDAADVIKAMKQIR